MIMSNNPTSTTTSSSGSSHNNNNIIMSLDHDTTINNNDNDKKKKQKRITKRYSSISRLEWPTNTNTTIVTSDNNDNNDNVSTEIESMSKNRKRKNIGTTSLSNNNTNNTNDNNKIDNDDQNQLWIEKYKPTNSKDLCIAPKKISEVREWIQQYTNNNHNDYNYHHHNDQYQDHRNKRSRSKLLILIGNAGIGKSTLIHVLANELQFNIIQWNELHHHEHHQQHYESQLSSFEDFLMSSALGCNIQLSNTSVTTTTTTTTISKTTNKKYSSLVVIDEIPNLHTIENKIRFQQIITNYITKSQIPTIFICSNDVQDGQYNIDELSKYIDPMILSSTQLTKIIQVNPVTKSKMKQCFLRIMNCESSISSNRKSSNHGNNNYSRGRKQHSRQNLMSIGWNLDSLVDEIHTQSGGDIRHAIMTLQFKFVGGNDTLGQNNNHRNNSDQGSNSSSSSNKQQRDVRLSAFHALGKLLYAKRLKEASTVTSTSNNAQGYYYDELFSIQTSLPPSSSSTSSLFTNDYHNATWNTDKRLPLEFNPETVLEHSTISLNSALNFVQYHSPDFFTNIDELSIAYDRFSDAAYLMDSNTNNNFPHYDGYTTSLISRSVADANKHPAPSKFRQFHAPKLFEVMKKRRENEIKVNILCKKIISCQFGGYMDSTTACSVWSSVAASTSSMFPVEYYPFLKRIIPHVVSSNLYSNNENFTTSNHHQYPNNNHPTNNIQNKNLIQEYNHQKDILELDDIEDSSDDDGDENNNVNIKKNSIVGTSSGHGIHSNLQKNNINSQQQQHQRNNDDVVKNNHNAQSDNNNIIIIDSDSD